MLLKRGRRAQRFERFEDTEHSHAENDVKEQIPPDLGSFTVLKLQLYAQLCVSVVREAGWQSTSSRDCFVVLYMIDADSCSFSSHTLSCLEPSGQCLVSSITSLDARAPLSVMRTGGR